MAKITFNKKTIETQDRESVLDAILRSGADAPYSCKTGSCHSCMMQATTGTPPSNAQIGLRDSLVAQNHFLSCVATADQDLEVCLPGDDVNSTPAVISSVSSLSESVIRVELQLKTEFAFHAGQFINLIRPDGLVRSYSVANRCDKSMKLELHVRVVPNGQMSNWLASDEAPSCEVQVRGPAGDCFYLPEYKEEKLLLVGTGTGLAPLLGIIRETIHQNHQQPIELYHGALQREGLYLVKELVELAEQIPSLQYRPCVLNDDTDAPLPNQKTGAIDQVVLDSHKDLSDWRIFLCGAPDMVHGLRRKVFLAGAHSKKIHADAFAMAKPPEPR